MTPDDGKKDDGKEGPGEEGQPPRRPEGPISNMRAKVSKMSKVEAQLVAITAVDLGDGNFELIYSFFTRSELVNLSFTVTEEEEVDSIADMFPGALNFEREIVDLFGLRFEGVSGGMMVTEESGIVAPLRKSSEPPTPASRARRGDDG